MGRSFKSVSASTSTWSRGYSECRVLICAQAEAAARVSAMCLAREAAALSRAVPGAADLLKVKAANDKILLDVGRLDELGMATLAPRCRSAPHAVAMRSTPSHCARRCRAHLWHAFSPGKGNEVGFVHASEAVLGATRKDKRVQREGLRAFNQNTQPRPTNVPRRRLRKTRSCRPSCKLANAPEAKERDECGSRSRRTFIARTSIHVGRIKTSSGYEYQTPGQAAPMVPVQRLASCRRPSPPSRSGPALQSRPHAHT